MRVFLSLEVSLGVSLEAAARIRLLIKFFSKIRRVCAFLRAKSSDTPAARKSRNGVFLVSGKI